jgi:hypothetical protein
MTTETANLIASVLFLICLGYCSFILGLVKGYTEQERQIVINKGELRGIVREIFRAGLEEKKRMEEVENE